MAKADFETIQLDRKGPIGILTLNRPDKLNAINPQMKLDIAAALDQVESDDDLRVLVLRGAGRAFCAGFDLENEGEGGVAHWREELQRDFDAIMRFWQLKKPTISAIHKYALAGGFEMAIACDITVAAEGTRLGEPELKFGSGIVALLLPWLTSPKKAKELILTGNDKIDAAEAHALGIVNRVVPTGEEFETAMAIARDIAVVDPAATRSWAWTRRCAWRSTSTCRSSAWRRPRARCLPRSPRRKGSRRPSPGATRASPTPEGGSGGGRAVRPTRAEDSGPRIARGVFHLAPAHPLTPPPTGARPSEANSICSGAARRRAP
jgi:enoyl-CoA hydratase